MELIERTHPLRVTFCKVVVDGHHVYALTRQCVEEHRECSHESLTLTGRHLRNVVRSLVAVHYAVEHHAADKLHIVVHHVPSHLVAAGKPACAIDSLVALYRHEILTGNGKIAICLSGCHLDCVVLCETACRLLHHGKHLREHLVKTACIHLEHLLAKLIDLLPIRLTLIIFESLKLGADLRHLILILLCLATYAIAYHVDSAAKFIV